MDINQLFSDRRTGKTRNYPDAVRSEYQRDYDRLIFSSAFRRLQNKTQVFPLPGSSFVHNRLTHSLEVAAIGRSLGRLAGHYIANNRKVQEEAKLLYQYELPNVIGAGCLAHDIGNPAFGHSGESAISNFFLTSNSVREQDFSAAEWADLTRFEGNANAFRILTHKFTGKQHGGQKLTYTALASILKYPCASTGSNSRFKHLKKYGFFQADLESFLEVTEGIGMVQESSEPLRYRRHPFVYLVEAADDIAYTIIDFEDAHRLSILSFDEIVTHFFALIKGINRKEDSLPDIEATLRQIDNKNERVAYLRSRAINSLALEANERFINSIDAIVEGTYNQSLVGEVEQCCPALVTIQKISAERIYNHDTVVQLELAGYNVMFELLQLMIPAVLKPQGSRSKLDAKAIRLIPEEFGPFSDDLTPYRKCLGVLDFVSGMTDIFATEVYRKIKGIEIGKHG